MNQSTMTEMEIRQLVRDAHRFLFDQNVGEMIFHGLGI